MDMPSSYHSTHRGSPRTSTSYTPSTALTSRAYSYPSPGSALNQSEDPVVIEIGTRYLRAGFANEPAPRCEILYSEDMWRRVGDKVVDSGLRGGTMLPHRTNVIPDMAAQSKKRSTRRSRGELWQHDLKTLDTGLVEDLLERALREAYNKYLLVDSKTKKVILPLPPLLPTNLIKAITNTIFKQFYPPTITYFSAPVLCTVSAGLRSALVVDIGWHETVITPIYELRVIGGLVGAAGRTKRAGKLLEKKTEEILERTLLEKGIEGKRPRESYVEELVQRVVWCETYEVRKRERELYHKTSRNMSPRLTPVSPVAMRTQGSSANPTFSTAGSATMLIPLQTPDSHKPLSINVPLSMLSLPVEHAFFESMGSGDDPDQEELPLPELLYKTLLACHIDVRAVCLSRIVIVGGPSNIPGLKGRLIDELCRLVEEKGGWNIVNTAKATRSKRMDVSALTTVGEDDGPPSLRENVVMPLTPKILPPHPCVELPLQTPTKPPFHGSPQVSRYRESPPQESLLQESSPHESPQEFLPQESLSQEQHPAELVSTTGEQHQEQWLVSLDRTRRYQELDARQNPKPSQPPGMIRGVKSLGAWVGGSIVAGARVRGICEVEREKFLSAVASGGVGLPSTML